MATKKKSDFVMTKDQYEYLSAMLTIKDKMNALQDAENNLTHLEKLVKAKAAGKKPPKRDKASEPFIILASKRNKKTGKFSPYKLTKITPKQGG